MLDDPAERDLFVYLPAGYEESVRRYATVYLLHAFGQSAESVVTPSTDARGGGRRSRTCWIGVRPDGVRPMIVVIPDGSCRWGCGQWVDSAGSGYFESYVAEDVVAFVDSTYRTVADSCSRGVFGFSSGWHWGLEHRLAESRGLRRGGGSVGGYLSRYDSEGLSL